MVHEGGHVSLDWAYGGSVKSSKWKKAAKASGVGRLAKPPAATYMKPTDYSAIR